MDGFQPARVLGHTRCLAGTGPHGFAKAALRSTGGPQGSLPRGPLAARQDKQWHSQMGGGTLTLALLCHLGSGHSPAHTQQGEMGAGPRSHGQGGVEPSSFPSGWEHGHKNRGAPGVETVKGEAGQGLTTVRRSGRGWALRGPHPRDRHRAGGITTPAPSSGRDGSPLGSSWLFVRPRESRSKRGLIY